MNDRNPPAYETLYLDDKANKIEIYYKDITIKEITRQTHLLSTRFPSVQIDYLVTNLPIPLY